MDWFLYTTSVMKELNAFGREYYFSGNLLHTWSTMPSQMTAYMKEILPKRIFIVNSFMKEAVII